MPLAAGGAHRRPHPRLCRPGRLGGHSGIDGPHGQRRAGRLPSPGGLPAKPREAGNPCRAAVSSRDEACRGHAVRPASSSACELRAAGLLLALALRCKSEPDTPAALARLEQGTQLLRQHRSPRRRAAEPPRVVRAVLRPEARRHLRELRGGRRRRGRGPRRTRRRSGRWARRRGKASALRGGASARAAEGGVAAHRATANTRKRKGTDSADWVCV